MRWCRFDSLAFAWASELEFRVQSAEFRVQSSEFILLFRVQFRVYFSQNLTDRLYSSRALCVILLTRVLNLGRRPPPCGLLARQDLGGRSSDHGVREPRVGGTQALSGALGQARFLHLSRGRVRRVEPIEIESLRLVRSKCL